MTDKLSMDCPEDACTGQLKFTMADVRHQRSVRCSRGHSVRLQDEGGGARKLERELRRIDSKFRW
jgi:hypothetical protein